jgi:hypothetical protein
MRTRKKTSQQQDERRTQHFTQISQKIAEPERKQRDEREKREKERRAVLPSPSSSSSSSSSSLLGD